MDLDYKQLEKGLRRDLFLACLISICIGSGITALIFFGKALFLFFGD